MKLRDLDILTSVVIHGSMAKAALDLGVSQPAVSDAIARLEAVTGARLLDRTTRGVEATVFGLALVNRATVVFDELDQGMREIEFMADSTRGDVRVGCPESLAAGFLPEVTASLARQYPNIRVHVSLAQPGEQYFTEIRQRQVDLLIGRLFKPVEADDLVVEEICQDAFFVVASSKSRWARRRSVSLSDLVDERWVLFPAGSLSNDFIDQGFRAAGLELPRNVVTSFSIQMRLHLLNKGDFLTVLHWSVLKFNASRWGLKVLPVRLPCGYMPISLFTMAGRTLTATVEKFVAQVRSVASSLDVRKANSKS
jgi:DNA-binding transcriptional LysR family regulator